MKKEMQVVGTIHCRTPRFWLDGQEVNVEGGVAKCDRVLINGAFLYQEEDDGPAKSGYASVFIDASEYAAKWGENTGEITIEVVTSRCEECTSRETGKKYLNFFVNSGEYVPESLTFLENKKPSDRVAAVLARCKKQWPGLPKVVPTVVEHDADDDDDIANA